MCIRHLRRVATCRQVRPLFQKGINALWSLDTAGSAPPSFGGFAKRQWFCPFVIGDTASKCVSMGVDVRHVVEVSGISWVKLRRIPGNTCESYLIGSSLFRSGLEHLDVVSGAPDAGAKTPGSYPGVFKMPCGTPSNRTSPAGSSPGLSRYHPVQELPDPARDFLSTICCARDSGSAAEVCQRHPVPEHSGQPRAFDWLGKVRVRGS